MPEPWTANSRRRFIVAVGIGLAAVVVPYLWVLSDLFTGSPSLVRTAQSDGYASNFYDLQTRAMFHGHLYIANGALGGEAFVHDGRQYTYFGLFPSLIRMPMLAVTRGLDGRITATSMLVAWVLAALFTCLLIWRVRIVVRSVAILSRMEAAAYGVLVATVMCGTVLVPLASTPWVFSEDLTWSVTLTVGSMFALLGVVERPSTGRVVGSGVLVLAANLTRGSTGYACVVGALLVSGWLALGRGGRDNRRWAVPMLVAGLVPLAVGGAVSYAKFGILFGLPESAQVVYQAFGLSHFGTGSYFGVHYLPSTLFAYFQPGGLRLTPVFPFITLPSAPARAVAGVSLFGTDRTASVPSSMPLLFLAGMWGATSTFRPHPVGRLASLRVVLVAAALAGGTVMIYGWIENRFLADILPVLILASAIGLVDIWRRLDTGSHICRAFGLVIVTVLGGFGIAANLGIASTPQASWSTDQILHYVTVQKNVSDFTGHPIGRNIIRGQVLPIISSADQLFVAGKCDGLYISDGNVLADLHPTFAVRVVELGTVWYPVQLGPDLLHTLNITPGKLTFPEESVPLVTIGTKAVSTIYLQRFADGHIRFSLSDPYSSAVGTTIPVTKSGTYRVEILTDPYRHLVSVTWRGTNVLTGILSSHGPVVVLPLRPTSGQPPPPTVVELSSGTSTSLCRSLSG